MPRWNDELDEIDVQAIATRVAKDTVARRQSVPYRGIAVAGPIVGPAALEAVAKVSSVRVALVTAMRQYDASVPRNFLSAVRSEDPAGSAWVERMIEKRRSYRAALARRLIISSAAAAAFDRDGAVIHISRGRS